MGGTTIRPLILVRGFGGLDVSAEQANAYQGFNEGTVYPGRRGDNYIYEGFLLRAMKSTDYPYRDRRGTGGAGARGPRRHPAPVLHRTAGV
jgi:hypothetical protein